MSSILRKRKEEDTRCASRDKRVQSVSGIFTLVRGMLTCASHRYCILLFECGDGGEWTRSLARWSTSASMRKSHRWHVASIQPPALCSRLHCRLRRRPPLRRRRVHLQLQHHPYNSAPAQLTTSTHPFTPLTSHVPPRAYADNHGQRLWSSPQDK